MTKAKEVYSIGETPSSSQKLNRQINDYLARGQLIISSCGSALRTQTGAQDVDGVQTGPLVTVRSTFYLGWYPYNPSKQVFDRLGIYANYSANDLNSDDRTADMHLQYSLNTGAGWTTASLADAITFPIHPPQNNAGVLTGGSNSIDISGIASFEWLGLRFVCDVTFNAATWAVFAFLYLSTDTPF